MFNSYVRSILGGRNFNTFYAPDGGGSGAGAGEGGSGEGAGEGAGNGEGEKGGEGAGNGEGTGAGAGEGEKSKTFTQDDVNAIAAKEAKKAQEKLLKQLGVTDFKNAKDALEKYQAILDAQKTDAQKAQEKAQQLETANGDLVKQNATLNAQLAALKQGVNAESLDDVIVLANNLVTDDVTVDDAITQVLKKYPHFKAEAQQQKGEGEKKPKFTQGEHKKDDKATEQETWMAAFNYTNKQ